MWRLSHDQKNCKNGGILNKDECVCEGCAPFGGKFCDVCEITAAMCKHGSLPDTASCSCKHPKGTEDRQCGPSGRWGGTYCDTCMVADSDCKHMSRLNPTLCQCEDKLKGPTGEGEMRCPEPWGGLNCDKCLPDRIFGEGEPIECGHGGSFSMVEGKCTNCAEGWGGPNCMMILVNALLQAVATSVIGWAIIRKPAACHAKMGGHSMLCSAFATVVSTRTQTPSTGRATTAQRHHRLPNTSATTMQTLNIMFNYY